jgi:beta-barrel assembly-enhancing protease
MKRQHLIKSAVSAAMVWAMALMPIAAMAQTRVSMPSNRYSVQDDVKLGREAAVEIEKQFPILNDYQSTEYVSRIGGNLVAAIPPQFRQPAFDYSFKIVNASDINAFALPGGPMYVNRGMIQAATNEGEMAGVMAHEIAHVAMRHATAQATKQGSWKAQLGTIGAILGGAILGGQTGAQLGALGVQMWQTRYSREYETQADILGSQIMARAGYDPRDLANMFQTIARQGGGRVPEFLSSHPDPGNRFQTINREAQLLEVSSNPIKITRDFQLVKSRLASMPPARTMAEIQQAGGAGSGGGTSQMGGGRYTNNVPLPSTRYRSYRSGNWISMNVPDNWREFAEQTSVTFAPDGAFGNQGISHGAMIGVFRGSSNTLAQNSQEFIKGLIQSNPHLRQQSWFQNSRFAGRQALVTQLAGQSPINRRTEVVTIYTTQLRNGETFYFAAVSPDDESNRYNTAFRTMLNSIRLSDAQL